MDTIRGDMVLFWSEVYLLQQIDLLGLAVFCIPVTSAVLEPPEGRPNEAPQNSTALRACPFTLSAPGMIKQSNPEKKSRNLSSNYGDKY